MYQTVIYETPAPHVARLVLNRPETRNAQDTRMLYELNLAFDRAAQDNDIKVIILAAAGPHFSSGHDLREQGALETMAEFQTVGTWCGFGCAGAEAQMAREKEIYIGFSERWRRRQGGGDHRSGASEFMELKMKSSGKVPWLRSRLAQGKVFLHQLSEGASWAGAVELDEARGACGLVVGVALVSAGSTITDILDERDAEERYLWNVHGRCAHLGFLVIEDAVALTKPDFAVPHDGSSRPEDVFILSGGVADRLQGVACSRAGSCPVAFASVSSVFAEWGVNPLSVTTCVQAYAPLALLVSTRGLSRLAAPPVARLALRLFGSWPPMPLQSRRDLVGIPSEEQDAQLYQPDRFVGLADSIRRWAPLILDSQGACDHDRVDAQFLLETQVSWLEHMALSLSHSTTTHSSRGCNGYRYKSDALIRTLLVADTTRDSGQLMTTVRSALAVLFPGMAAHVDRMCQQDLIHIPTKSSLSKARLYLDVALMLFARAEFTASQPRTWPSEFSCSSNYSHLQLALSGSCRYLWADSSPQGGTDWLISQVSTVAAGTVIETSNSLNRLIASDQASAERRALSKQVCGAFATMVNPPVALGQRATTLPHKLQALLHSVRLSVSSLSDLHTYFSTVASLTSDFGTEIGLAEVPVTFDDLRGLFPPQRAPLNIDDDVGEAGAGLLRSGCTHASSSLFQHALVIPGMIHILSNLTEQIVDTLAC